MERHGTAYRARIGIVLAARMGIMGIYRAAGDGVGSLEDEAGARDWGFLGRKE